MTFHEIRQVGQHWLQAATMALAMVAVALLGWSASQLIGMRDDIHTLKDALPSIESRVTRLESRADDVSDLRAARMARGDGP